MHLNVGHNNYGISFRVYGHFLLLITSPLNYYAGFSNYFLTEIFFF